MKFKIDKVLLILQVENISHVFMSLSLQGNIKKHLGVLVLKGASTLHDINNYLEKHLTTFTLDNELLTCLNDTNQILERYCNVDYNKCVSISTPEVRQALLTDDVNFMIYHESITKADDTTYTFNVGSLRVPEKETFISKLVNPLLIFKGSNGYTLKLYEFKSEYTVLYSIEH